MVIIFPQRFPAAPTIMAETRSSCLNFRPMLHHPISFRVGHFPPPLNYNETARLRLLPPSLNIYILRSPGAVRSWAWVSIELARSPWQHLVTKERNCQREREFFFIPIVEFFSTIPPPVSFLVVDDAEEEPCYGDDIRVKTRQLAIDAQ